jgi:hypothetical protein
MKSLGDRQAALAWALVMTFAGCDSSGGLAIGGSLSDGSAAADDSSPPDPGASGPVSGLFGGRRENFPSSDFSRYDHVQNRTTIGAQARGDAATDGRLLTLFVPGDTSGPFSCDQNPDGGLTIGIVFSQADATYSTTGLAWLTPCAITIDAYGAVGGQVTGTFSGTLVATSRVGNPLPPQQIAATDGTFAVTRLQDP